MAVTSPCNNINQHEEQPAELINELDCDILAKNGRLEQQAKSKTKNRCGNTELDCDKGVTDRQQAEVITEFNCDSTELVCDNNKLGHDTIVLKPVKLIISKYGGGESAVSQD